MLIPKHLYGLLLCNLEVMNKACLMKHNWKMINNSNDMWCLVLKGVYRDINLRDPKHSKSSDSGIWRAICKTIPQLLETGFGSLGDESYVGVCRDN